MTFHIPAWILAIMRTHYFRLLTEQKAGWPGLVIIEVRRGAHFMLQCLTCMHGIIVDPEVFFNSYLLFHFILYTIVNVPRSRR